MIYIDPIFDIIQIKCSKLLSADLLKARVGVEPMKNITAFVSNLCFPI